MHTKVCIYTYAKINMHIDDDSVPNDIHELFPYMHTYPYTFPLCIGIYIYIYMHTCTIRYLTDPEDWNNTQLYIYTHFAYTEDWNN